MLNEFFFKFKKWAHTNKSSKSYSASFYCIFYYSQPFRCLGNWIHFCETDQPTNMSTYKSFFWNLKILSELKHVTFVSKCLYLPWTSWDLTIKVIFTQCWLSWNFQISCETSKINRTWKLWVSIISYKNPSENIEKLHRWWSIITYNHYIVFWYFLGHINLFHRVTQVWCKK